MFITDSSFIKLSHFVREIQKTLFQHCRGFLTHLMPVLRMIIMLSYLKSPPKVSLPFNIILQQCNLILNIQYCF